MMESLNRDFNTYHSKHTLSLLRRREKNRETVDEEIMTKNLPALTGHKARDSRNVTKAKQHKYTENLT